MTDTWLRRAIGVLTATAALLLALDVHGPLRVTVLVVFVMFCPGVAWARVLRTGDALDTIGIGIAISIALAAVIGEAMALAAWWSPGTGFIVLATITAAGVATRPRVAREA